MLVCGHCDLSKSFPKQENLMKMSECTATDDSKFQILIIDPFM